MFEGLSKHSDKMLAILRIVSALIFLLHGSQKLFGFPPPGEMGQPEMFSFLWIGGVIEFVGGVLLLLGLWTRPVAFIISGEMAVAYWMFHAPANLFPTLNGGDAAILYCFIFLYFVFAGPGAWSLDGAMRKRKTAPAAT